jgi:hypothetical protein
LVLVDVFGHLAIRDLIASGALGFVRLRGSLAYIGNGNGLSSYLIQSPGGDVLAPMADTEAAFDWAVGGLAVAPRDRAFKELVLRNTETLSLEGIQKEVCHETYMDVLKSPDLSQLFGRRNRNLTHLRGIRADQVRIYGGKASPSQGDEIELLLRLAHTNLELRMAQVGRCENASTESPIKSVLEAKGVRVRTGQSPEQQFTVLRELADIPDVAEAVVSKAVSLSDILRLRQSSDGEAFRKWFHERCMSAPQDVAKEYARILKAVPAIDTTKGRAIRFLVATGLGAIPVVGAGLGLAASVIDSFFLEKLARGNSPKFFLADLESALGAPVAPKRG